MYLVLNFKSNLGTYGHDFVAYERDARGRKFAPVQIVHMNTAGVVLCGSPKKQPRTLSIVQFIFFFWSFEISGNILRNQKNLFV